MIDIDSLFGEAFDIKLDNNKPNVKTLVNKIENQAKAEVSTDKVLKSKKLSLQERLDYIKEKVLAKLGKQKNNILVIKDKQVLHDYISRCIKAGRIDIDTETNNSLDPVTCKLMGPCFYAPGEKQAYIPINHVDPNTNVRLPWQLTEADIKEELQRVLDTNTFVVMHNGKFDYEVIKCTCGIKVRPNWDTIVAARLINENEPSGLKTLYVKYIDPDQEKYSIEELFENIPYEFVDPDIFAFYAATDAFMTDKLYLYQKPILEAPGNERLKWVFENIEMPIVVVTAEMELTGVKVDVDFGARLKEKYNNQLNAIDEKVNQQIEALKMVIEIWKRTPQATNPAKVYQSTKSKMSDEKLIASYPYVDEEVNLRYKFGKAKIDQLEDPISLTSPVQLGILFYDILKCPAPSKKSPRGTGEAELEALAESFANEANIIKFSQAAAKSIWAGLQNNLLEEENSIVLEQKKEKSDEDIEYEDLYDEDLDEDFEDDEDIEVSQITLDINNLTEEQLVKMYMQAFKAAKNLCKLILDRRGIVKLLTTYIDVIPELTKHWPDGRIRFHLNSLGTDTGRYSSGGKLKFIEDGKPVVVSGINIQNIPSHNKEIRMLFEAENNENMVNLTDNFYTVDNIAEVETTLGWKYARDLVPGDLLLDDNTQKTVLQIIPKENKYLIYVR